VLAAPFITASGVRRSCDTELRSVLRSCSASISTPRALRLVAELHALHRDGHLRRESARQPPLLRVPEALRIPREDAEHAADIAPADGRGEREVQALAAGHGVRPEAGLLPVAPHPAHDAHLLAVRGIEPVASRGRPSRSPDAARAKTATRASNTSSTCRPAGLEDRGDVCACAVSRLIA
jgi:hypothetical protein